MFKLDLLITPVSQYWAVFAPTDKGKECFRKYLKTNGGNLGYGLLFGSVPVIEGQKFYNQVRNHHHDVNMYFFPEKDLTYTEAFMAAEAMAAEFQLETVRGKLTDYYTKKLEAAIEERNGREAYRLYEAMPTAMSVEKSFLVMKLTEAFGVEKIVDIAKIHS